MTADRWLVLVAVALLVVSLFLPAIDGPGFPALSGMDVLRQGAGVWRDGVVAWYANPALLFALIMCVARRFRLALGASLAAGFLALSSFGAGPVAESLGRDVPAFGFAPGFYLWLLAFAAAACAAALGIYKESRSPAPG